MADDGIPEELQDGGEETPDECVDAIQECVQNNEPGLTITSIGAVDSVASLMGDHEQRYQVDVFKPNNGGGRRGMVLVDAYKEGSEWKADFIQSTL